MEQRPSVFVGSSVEGMKFAEAIQRRLDYAADVELWNQATFDLSSVTIEALEEKCRAADFAIFVLTPDDVKVKREKTTAAARDNVIFELGIFTGSLGRERCFLVYEDGKEIDLPSDFAGITPAKFRVQQSGDLDASLGAASSKIQKAMEKHRLRRKLSENAVARIQELGAFAERITGFWWQRVLPDDASALSFVRIEPDPAASTVKMGGVAYHTDGTPIANWSTLSASLGAAERKLSYIWEGLHPGRPNDPYQGFGLITFDDANAAFDSARGYFFNANLADLKTARRKSLELRRCVDAAEIAAMRSQDGATILAAVLKKLRSW